MTGKVFKERGGLFCCENVRENPSELVKNRSVTG